MGILAEERHADLARRTERLIRVHLMRNVLAHAGKQGRRVVSAFIGTAFAQNDAAFARAQWRQGRRGGMATNQCCNRSARERNALVIPRIEFANILTPSFRPPPVSLGQASLTVP